MDNKFRLVVCEAAATPSAAAYLSGQAQVFDTLWDAIKAGVAQTSGPGVDVYFIAHRHIVFDPLMIPVLIDQIVAKGAEDWI